MKASETFKYEKKKNLFLATPGCFTNKLTHKTIVEKVHNVLLVIMAGKFISNEDMLY